MRIWKVFQRAKVAKNDLENFEKKKHLDSRGLKYFSAEGKNTLEVDPVLIIYGNIF